MKRGDPIWYLNDFLDAPKWRPGTYHAKTGSGHWVVDAGGRMVWVLPESVRTEAQHAREAVMV